MPPDNKPKRRGNQGHVAPASIEALKKAGKAHHFVKGDKRINRKGRPKLASEIRQMLRDPVLASKWAAKIRLGVEEGDLELLKLYGKHAVGTEDKLEVAGNVQHDIPALKNASVEQLLELAKRTK